MQLIKNKKPELKPEGVDIKTINTAIMPTGPTDIMIMVFGLGTDNRIYKYNGKDKSWEHQD